ncbi:Serine/threonine protein kinase [Aspergillus melleus]|uniref:Serine/threonine protein kinase n=1 Tax=Aspergillus melleus TaxID=138277 RepID=UPI001E8DA2E1|nr:Serine/threonine protein kinase [Aspergillus melleus]KAH8429084.1 Serine/threonine protein kinase [Aspergillus melleus]
MDDKRPKLETLASIATKVRNGFVRAGHSVAGGNLEDNSRLVNQTQRFELWAKNLGLYHLGHSSLDYRFRDAPSLFGYTFGLLRNLDGLLIQLINTLNSGHETCVDATIGPVEPNDQLSDDSEEDDFESSDDESVTDLLLTGVTATIDKLYRLSFKVRNPTVRLGLSKALKYHEFDPETGVDIIDQFKEYDQRHLEQLFASYRSISPEVFEQDFLARRLAKANTRRRQQFRYWKDRRARFEAVSRPELIENIASDPMLQRAGYSPMAPSRPSTATYLDTSKVKLDDDSSIISSSTTVNIQDDMQNEEAKDFFFIPPPPKHLWDGDEVECPYCFTLCPRKILRQGSWE